MYDKVLVVWTDAESSDDWDQIKSFQKEELPKVETLGFLVHANDDLVTLVQNLDLTNGAASMSMTIPRVWIHEIKRLTWDSSDRSSAEGKAKAGKKKRLHTIKD